MKKLSAVFLIVLSLAFAGCLNNVDNIQDSNSSDVSVSDTGNSAADELTLIEHVENEYAEQFSIDRYEGGFSKITTMNGEEFLIVPEGKTPPEKLDESITVIEQPAENFYLAATAAMGHFAEIGAGNSIKFSSINADDWYIDYAREAMKSGEMVYAGKYREPDYELLLTGKCKLAIESTMIEHSPAVKEKLLELGIPVFIDYASYENHPLGRAEWIKVYGEITGKSAEAERIFDEQAAKLKLIENSEKTEKTVAFFYINSAGQAVVRKSGDYITKMIELAGGKYVFEDLSGGGLSTVVIEPEAFYNAAKDADIVIYNSTIGGEVDSLESIVAKCSLLSDFKAFKDGNVWCTKENLYQESIKFGEMINDFHSVLTGKTEEEPPVFLFRPKD